VPSAPSTLNVSRSFASNLIPYLTAYADLENMGVRATMSVVSTVLAYVSQGYLFALKSIMAFGTLWGLVMCHSYGSTGMRVSFPVRHMLRLLSQSLSRNVERLIYAHHIKSRKIVRSCSWAVI
jgi:light-regulated signal transduction histidine kinase (bacteriophytochrome)